MSVLWNQVLGRRPRLPNFSKAGLFSIQPASLFIVVIVAFAICSCDASKQTDSSKEPIEVKEAEAKDPTRLDSARTDQEPTWGKEKGDSSSAGSP